MIYLLNELMFLFIQFIINILLSIVVNEDSHLLCKSQYANPLGVCSEGTKSTNKGQTCEIDDDCPSSDGTSYAKCMCGWNTDKIKYCDLLPGDDEWVDVRSKFNDYF